MRLTVEGSSRDVPSVRRAGLSIELIDQTLLPARTEVLTVSDPIRMAECIRSLRVRGAPAIGAFAGTALAVCAARGEDPGRTYDLLCSTRPTAVDLRNCLDRVMTSLLEGGPQRALDESDRICAEIVEACRRIGEEGAVLFGRGTRFLTHCNAGALATIDWGTALSPIRTLHRNGGRPFVNVSETRPLLQGSRLTAWELAMEGIPHRVVADSACAHLMREGLVDAVIVGADRVCRNGDFANKIGTLDKAILADRYDVPFYVAFPWTTFDPSCERGEDIPIEHRGPEEFGLYLLPGTAQTSECWNPAFDRTPADLVTAFITDRGVLEPGRIGDTDAKL